MEILLIYRGWFGESLPLSPERISIFLGMKSLFPYQRLILPYQGLIFREVWDLEARKFGDKYFSHISLFYPFVHNELAISERTANGRTWNSRRASLRLTFGRILRLSQTSIRISHLGSAYQFYMEGGLGLLHIVGQENHGLGRSGPVPIE